MTEPPTDPNPPAPDTPADPVGPVVCALIKAKARRLMGRAGLTPQDRADVEQELALKLLERRPKYDPSRGPWPGFAKTVLRSAGENLVRFRAAACRANAARLQPLEGDRPAPEPESVAEPIDAGAVRDAVAQLDGDERRAAEIVLDGTGTVAAISCALGLSRHAARALLRGLRTHPAFEALAPPDPPD